MPQNITSYPPRIQAFRDEIIRMVPKVPNTRHSLADMQGMPTRRLILAYMTWRMRLIPAKPRRVRLWSGGVKPAEFYAARERLRPLLMKVEAGKDLTPHLSDEVNRKGVVLRKPGKPGRREDIDMVLTRQGLHHFHVGKHGPGNPKGRSQSLVFAEVLENEFRIVALSDHRAFERGSPEQERFFNICHSYMAKDVPPGVGHMANPVQSSGHSSMFTIFADYCEDKMQELDPQLDDPAYVDKLYNEQPIERDGQPIGRPPNPLLTWHFEDLRFGVLDKRTMVFFCMFPYFTR
jgi:hypothetical protein